MNYKTFSSIMSYRPEPVQPAPQPDKHYELYDAPPIQLQLLLLQDRAIYNIDRALELLEKSKYASDEYVRSVLDLIIKKTDKYEKKGCIGKYKHTFKQNLNMQEQCALADIMEEYDEKMLIAEKHIINEIKGSIAAVSNTDSPELLSSLIYAEIVCNYVGAYHKEVNTKLKRRCYLRNMQWSGEPFDAASHLIDRISYYISGSPIDFDDNSKFIAKYDQYFTTICNEKRVIHYNNQLNKLKPNAVHIN